MKNWITAIACIAFLMGFAQDDFVEKRTQMVKTQLEARDIRDTTTLRAMLAVRRHLFVPENIRKYSYTDRPLPIGDGQTISQPYIVAYMTQALRLESSDKVLEIGTGSGYQAAVLSKIVDSVFTIEIVEPLGIAAEKRFKHLGYTNIYTKIGDGYHGWPDQAPFDAIIVTAAVQKIPPKLLEQLGERGRMIIPVGKTKYRRYLVLATKKNGNVKTKKLIPVAFVPFTRNKE